MMVVLNCNIIHANISPIFKSVFAMILCIAPYIFNFFCILHNFLTVCFIYDYDTVRQGSIKMKISFDLVDFRKRKAICIFVCMIFIGTGVVPSFANVLDDNVETEARTNMNESKKWTFMFYDDADFPGYDPLIDTVGGLTFAEAAYSGEDVDVIVLQDIENGPATMWYVDESHNIEKLEDMGEANMANGSTLKNFVEYCKDEYPAERYVLAIYNHGGGIWGACIDYASNGDILTMDEMQKALTESGGVDILCFSAPCLMGAVECVYELRDCVDVYVGSEEISGYTLWHDAMGSLCDTLNENPDISNIDLGEKIIEWIEEDAKTNIKWGSLLSMSAIRTDKIEDLATSIDELSIYLNENFNDAINNIRKTRRKTKEVGRPILHWFKYRQSIDFLDFIQKYNEIESDPIICQHLQNITEAFNEAVIKECHRFLRRKTNGLSIYFPMTTLSYGYSSTYHNVGYGLDFPQDTHWDEFLLKYKASGIEVFYTFFPFLRPRISM